VIDRIASDDRHRRVLAAPHARRAHHAHVRPARPLERGTQRGAAGHLARQRLAYPNGQRGRRRLAFLHDVEVVIERPHFVDLGLRELHLGCEGDQMRGGNVAEAVLDTVQELDQQVCAARDIAQQCLHVGQRRRVERAALHLTARLAALAERRSVDDGPLRHCRAVRA
jgi:hypothetical protein